MISNSFKVLGIFTIVVIIVFLFLCVVDVAYDGKHNVEHFATYNKNYNSEISGLNSFINRLNTTPAIVEFERIKLLTGLDGITYVIYAVILVINIIFIRFLKQYERNSIIVVFGLYNSFAVTLLLDMFLRLTFPSWGFNYTIRLLFNGLGMGLLSSTISLSIHSLRNLKYTLKQEGISLFEMITNKVTTPDIKVSLSSARTWSLFSVLVFGFLFINIIFNNI